MKKLIVLVLGFILFFCGCDNKTNKDEQSQNDIVKIGVILPLTGNLAEPGKRILNGIKLSEGNSDNYELIIEDSAADPKKSINAIKKLIHQDKVNIVIGDMTSSCTLAIAPIAEKNKVILLSPGASSPKLSNAGEYIFRNWMSDGFEGKVIGSYAFQHLAKTASIVYIDNDYGIGLSNTFTKEFEKLGGKIDLTTGYNPKTTDFKSIANRVIGSKLLYLPGEPIPNGILVKTLKEQGFFGKIVSNLSVQYDDFLKIAKKSANGIVYSSPSLDLEKKTKIITNFVDSYQDIFQTKPDIASAHGFDAFNIVNQALEKCLYKTSELKQCLQDVNIYEGVTGEMKFDKNGDVLKDIDIYRIENMKGVFLQKFKSLSLR